VSPHIGGPTRDLYGECGAFAWRNLRRFLAGQPLEAVITLPIYDRAT
jgi:phosphoglycerate dehydrogenase-like enzyme